MFHADALEHADIIYATEVQHIFDETDVFFPELDTSWRKIPESATQLTVKINTLLTL